MVEFEPVVYVVDDDPGLRQALSRLLRSVGLGVRTFGSAKDFLRDTRPKAAGCLVLDVRMPGMDGLDLQREMANAGIHLPIVFITGHGDIQMSVKAMKAGAIEFLTKPFRDQDLLDAIQTAIERSRASEQIRAEGAELGRRLHALTPRELQVMQYVVKGLPNKQIAALLGTSEVTIKVHRARVMQKMKAESLADLVRMTERLKSRVAGSGGGM